MQRFHCPCGSSFAAESASAVAEHDGRCPACFDIVQILGFADSAGDTIPTDDALRVIRGICHTRLARPPA